METKKLITILVIVVVLAALTICGAYFYPLQAPMSAADCRQVEKYEEVFITFLRAGFLSIETEPICDPIFKPFFQSGEVAQVYIAGRNDFEEGECFPKDATVTIQYYLFPDIKSNDEPVKETAPVCTVLELQQSVERACSAFTASDNKALEGELSYEIESDWRITFTFTVTETIHPYERHLIDTVTEQIREYLRNELDQIELPQFFASRISVNYRIYKGVGSEGSPSENFVPVYFLDKDTTVSTGSPN